jgi:putative membrane protein
MKPPRSPASFRVDPVDRAPPTETRPREPAAIRDLQRVEVILDEIDAIERESESQGAAAPPLKKKRGMRWGAIFFSALGLLVSLALGLWTESLIRELFERSEWLGWTSAALAALAVIGLLGLVLRELLAILRLRSVARLQDQAAAARLEKGPAAARAVIAGVAALVSTNPATAQGRQRLAETEGEILDGADLLLLAEKELLGNLDRAARRIVMDSAQRVSIVTAVSPRALVDIAFVLYEASRMIRRLSLHYGGRPGGLGFVKLVRDVISHLAVTGSIAIGDGLVEQLVGHGLAARLSARLGEGVINGLMTVRIGIAAIETVRPMPFVALRRPSMSDFLPALTGRRKGN